MVEFYINNRKYNFREVLDDLHKVWLIVTDNCQYCEREGIKTPDKKIDLIRRILNKYYGDSDGGRN